MSNHTTNREGLTWSEWLAASACAGLVDSEKKSKVLRKAWRDGEDPTDYRAAKENGSLFKDL